MTYVVHGAAGAQGKPVLSALLAAGKSVVPIGRKGGAEVAGHPVVAADYDSVADLADAYRGAAGVFVHLPLGSPADRLRYARNIVAALGDARPGRVVISTSGQIIDSPESPLHQPDSAAVPTLVRGVAETGLSHAVISSRLFLENLLLPPVIGGVRADSVLRYPLRADFPVSWASHLDIADVAVALFERADVTGVLNVGQLPPITGADLAAAFASRVGRAVAYESIAPERFGASITPVVGSVAADNVVALYRTYASLPEFTFEPDRSAQHHLDVAPRTTQQWLDELGI